MGGKEFSQFFNKSFKLFLRQFYVEISIALFCEEVSSSFFIFCNTEDTFIVK